MKNANNITVVWSFRNRIEKLNKSIATADKYMPKNINFCLIDASSEEATIRKLRIFCSKFKNRKIRICESSYRSSLSEAWNLGIILSDTRFVIFASSDVEFTDHNLVSELYKMINAGFEYVLIENHAVFMIDKKLIPRIGWFDERYDIGPHFDTDYLIRCSEKKCKFIIVSNDEYYTHFDSNTTIEQRRRKEFKDRLPMHDLSNEKFFKRKWLSEWKGWKNGDHPPTNISEVKRRLPEIDPHPLFTEKYKSEYARSAIESPSSLARRLSIKISHRLK